jgi:hypothetical protein
MVVSKRKVGEMKEVRKVIVKWLRGVDCCILS